MKNVLSLPVIVVLSFQVSGAFAAGLDSSAYINQASGVTSKAMSMADVMAPVENLAASLPHLPAIQGNYSFVLQSGDYNNAAIVQSGLNNASLVAQTGYQNSAIVQQFGSGHQSFVIQNGVGNIASVTQR